MSPLFNQGMLTGTRYTSFHPLLLNHGGGAESGLRARQHHQEMEDVANDICQQYFTEELPRILDNLLESKLNEIYKASFNSFIDNLTFDVETAVNVAFQNGENIFHDRRTQEVVANHVLNEIKRQMGRTKFSLKL